MESKNTSDDCTSKGARARHSFQNEQSGEETVITPRKRHATIRLSESELQLSPAKKRAKYSDLHVTEDSTSLITSKNPDSSLVASENKLKQATRNVNLTDEKDPNLSSNVFSVSDGKERFDEISQDTESVTSSDDDHFEHDSKMEGAVNFDVPPVSGSSHGSSLMSNQAKLLTKPGISFEIGERIEALDKLQKWYVAKIIDIDTDEQLVLIHFDGWNSRYDEWIPCKSNRIRPVARISARNEARKRTNTEFSEGEMVMARWTDRKMYPAKIVYLNSTGRFLTVQFYDGVKKKLQKVSIDKLPAEMAKKDFAEIRVKNLSPSDKASSPSKKLKTAVTNDNGSGRTRRKKLIIGGIFQAKRKFSEDKETKRPVCIDDKNEDRSAASSAVKMPHKVEVQVSDIGAEIHKMTSVNVSVVPWKETAVDNITTNTTEVIDRRVARKEFIIEEDHNHFKCTFDDCSKSFRKEKLLAAHLKHYHGTKKTKARRRKGISPKSSALMSPNVTPKTYSNVKKFTKVMKDSPQPISVEKLSTEEIATPTASDAPPDVQQEPNVKPDSTIASSKPDKPVANTVKKVYSVCSTVKTVNKNVKSSVKVDNVTKSSKNEINEEKSSSKPAPSNNASVTSAEKEKLQIPKDETQKPNTSSKSKTVDHDFGKIRSISESEKTKPVVNVRTSKRKRLDTNESVASTISVDSSIQSEDCAIVDTEMPRHRKSKSESEARKPSRSSRSRKRINASIIRDEIINCSCGVNDENGFMVQCELCNAWQHGSCANMTKEDDVPEKYICKCCLHPKLGRENMRYLWCQDWYKKGEMAKFIFLDKPSTDQSSSMLSAHNLVSSLLSMKTVIHSLKYKLKVAQNKYHPDIDLFKQPWTKDCKLVLEKFNDNDASIDSANIEAIASAIGAIGIPLGSLSNVLAASTSSGDTGMFFDSTFFPSSKPQEVCQMNNYYLPSGSDTLMPPPLPCIPVVSNSLTVGSETGDIRSVDKSDVFKESTDGAGNFSTDEHETKESTHSEGDPTVKDEPCVVDPPWPLPASNNNELSQISIDNESSAAITTNNLSDSNRAMDIGTHYEEVKKEIDDSLKVVANERTEVGAEKLSETNEKSNESDERAAVSDVTLDSGIDHSPDEVVSRDESVSDAYQNEDACDTVPQIDESRVMSHGTDANYGQTFKTPLIPPSIEQPVTLDDSNKSLMDQYIPDLMSVSESKQPTSLQNIEPSNILGQNSSELATSATNDLNVQSDFNEQLSLSDSELVQGIGLSGGMVDDPASQNSGSGLLSGDDFVTQAAMMATLTKEEEDEMIKTLSRPMYPMIPVPREPDTDQFQKNVLYHVEELQDELEHRLGILEAQVEILEMEFESQPIGKPVEQKNDSSKIRKTLRKFLGDFEKMKLLTTL